MANEDVKFKRGLSTTIPETKVPGTVYITTDTGEMFVDDTTDNRVRVNTQANYTQNDNTAADYIKNRPFYSEGFISDVTLLDGTFDFAEERPGLYVHFQKASSLTFEELKTYTVVFDGTSYSCTGYIPADGFPVVVLGNASIAEISGGGNNEPFLILVDDNGLYIATNLTSASHTVKITSSEENIKKLDAKYLPDEIRKTPSSKMNKANPTGTGSFSLNRKDNTKIGNYSFAEGYLTTASGKYSHAEGGDTSATGSSSHAEGQNTTASGQSSHAEGFFTKASGVYQHAQGKYNIEDSAGTYADIVGNGTGVSARSNAATVDWSGNAWYAGDVYVGSTSGTNKDEGSKKLATEEYVNSAVITVDSALSDTSTNPVQNKVINTALSNKVDKVDGKGLSTNDYTTEEKSKLEGIAPGAEINVNADWNATEGDAQILNKPSIPSKTSDLTNDSGFITSSDIPEGAAASNTVPKMDGTAAVGSELAFARGDHVHPSDTTKADKTELANYIPLSYKGANNGVAELDSTGKVPSSQLPSYVDDVIEGYYYNSKFYKESTHTTEITGEAGKIYVDISGSNKTYRWGGSESGFVEISESLALGETESTAFRGDYGKAAYTHAVTNKGLAFTSGLYKITTNSEGHVTAATAVTKSDITGLGIPGEDTNTATAADDILDGSNTGTEVKYSPYTSQQSKLSFDTSTTDPTRTDRLNLNGYLYATKLYSNGTEVLTSQWSAKNVVTTSAGLGDAATTNPYLNLIENNTIRSTHQIKGAGSVSVDSDSSGNITITGTDTDTKVTQAAAITTAGDYPILLGYDTSTTAVTNTVNKASSLTFDPSTGTLTATKIEAIMDDGYLGDSF